ncbi:MAG: DUF4388 domain-containing protein [Acidimicrobiales bacterium]|nr:DUF4388 domain-containing protein [Acidimicrobiales bacterium]
MALQGDLNSFALPEVLRLLAGTAKSGRLDVTGDAATGALHLADGAVADAHVSCAPGAEGPADVLFEMLRFDDGAFSFDEGEVATGGDHQPIEEVIEAAEALVAEWTEVETVVPSMAAWITLAAEPPGDESVKLSPDRWRLVATIAGGGTVADLARGLGLRDLAACQAVKGLADDGLVEVRASHTYDVPVVEIAPDGVELDDFSSYEEDGYDDHPMTELEDLVVEDRPVVMTEGDDALLPEPLPGEGVAYDGEEIVGVVDGFRSEAEPEVEIEPEPQPEHEVEPEPVAEEIASEDPFAALAAATAYEDPMAGSPLAAALSTEAPAGDVVEAEVPAPVAPVANEELAAPPVEGGFEDDEERGSLLRFLSTVKP